MTIKQRLIVSHVTVFIVPLLMTLLVIAFSCVGLIMFARNGNHIYIESASEFQHSCELIHHVAFNHLDDVSENDIEYWLVGLLAPDQNYISLQKSNQVIYTYGNKALSGIWQEDLDKARHNADILGKEYTDINTLENDFVYIEKQIINGDVYWLYFVTEKSLIDKDEDLETALDRTLYFTIISLIAFVLVTSALLTRFIMRNILQPLNKLQAGADKIREGELDLHLEHDSDDEIKPVMEAFNLMSERLLNSLQESKRQEESRKELVASMSHDLRTPLTTIKAYIEGLIDHVADTPEKQDRYFRVIKKNADELNSMIEQLFLFSKISLGEKAIPLEKINLKNMLEFFVSENEYSWQKAGATVTLDSGPNVIIMGSSMLFERILANVIGNSIKYKPDFEIKCNIKIIVSNETAILSVSDNGSGVPEESLERLTEPFYRTDKARSRTEDGTGLGLSIAARAVEMMHGNIRIENAKPHGLTVIIELPILRSETYVENTNN